MGSFFVDNDCYPFSPRVVISVLSINEKIAGECGIELLHTSNSIMFTKLIYAQFPNTSKDHKSFSLYAYQ